MREQNRLLYGSALLVSFLSYLLANYLNIYTDALFLSTYPVKLLAYFYFSSAFILILATFIIQPFIRQASKLENCFLLFLTGIITIIYAIALLGLAPQITLSPKPFKNKTRFYHYSLLNYLLIVVIVSYIAFTLIEYAMKAEIATRYDRTTIANFMGIL